MTVEKEEVPRIRKVLNVIFISVFGFAIGAIAHNILTTDRTPEPTAQVESTEK